MSLSLAENVIVVEADNHPTMLDKTNYSSWASGMLLYIKGNENGKLLVDSVLNRPFQYGSMVEPGNETTPATIRARTYTDLTDEEKIHESVDYQGTNIVLQELIRTCDFILNPSDGLIANLNKLMAFVTIAFALRFPQTNNQLRNSSNPRNQATIQDGRAVNRQGDQVKQEWLNVTTVKRKVILLDSALNQKGLRTQHNNRDTIIRAQASQEIPTLAAFQIDDLDAFDFDYDDVPSAKAVLMANLSSYDSYVLLEVPFHDINIENNVSYQSVQKNQCFEQPSFDNDTEVDITSDSNIISYEQYLQETKTPVVQSTSSYAQQDALLMCVIEEMSSQVAKCNKVQQENIDVNETLTAELKRYKEQVIVDRNAKESNQKEDKYLDKVIDLQKKNKALDNVVYKIGNLKLAKESRIMKQDNAKQAAHDENLVPSADRVKIGKSNLRMDPFVNQREETYQVVLEIIKNTPFYNTFLIFADRTISTSKKKQSNEKLVLHDESDESEGELEHRLTGRKKRTPRTVIIQEPPSLPKALKASKCESRFQHQIGSSSKGDGVRLEVLDELTRKSSNSNKGAGTSPKVLDELEDKMNGWSSIARNGSENRRLEDATFVQYGQGGDGDGEGVACGWGVSSCDSEEYFERRHRDIVRIDSVLLMERVVWGGIWELVIERVVGAGHSAIGELRLVSEGRREEVER
ncbi:hypothetical protein Tco_0789907 [Tanacetum coccineum]